MSIPRRSPHYVPSMSTFTPTFKPMLTRTFITSLTSPPKVVLLQPTAARTPGSDWKAPRPVQSKAMHRSESTTPGLIRNTFRQALHRWASPIIGTAQKDISCMSCISCICTCGAIYTLRCWNVLFILIYTHDTQDAQDAYTALNPV